MAGPNARGTLFFHANPDLSYRPGRQYVGVSGLQSCSAAKDSVSVDGVHIVHVMAAFPARSSPRLSGVTFGLFYDRERVAIANWQKCGDFELSTSDWPGPGSRN